MRFTWFVILMVVVCLTAYTVKRNFGGPEKKGEIVDNLLTEISGVVASVRNEGYLWVHNDSGHLPNLYLIDSTGRLVKTFHLKDAVNLDWEDMALGIGDDNVPYLYVGDIGDNFGFLPYRTIYRLKEPFLDDKPEIVNYEQMVYAYEDGPRDAETLLVDPADGKILVVSKREKPVRIYSSAFQPDTVRLKKEGEVNLTQIVGGDISADGKQLLLKNYQKVFFWDLSVKGISAVFEEKPQVIVSYVAEPQGEAIGWDTRGKGFYTISEFGNRKNSVLYYYPSL